jgi:hypothetical protein
MKPKLYYPNQGGLVDLACAVVQLAVKDLRDGRRYHRDEMDPEMWLAQAGMLHLAQQAIAAG